MIYKAVQLGKLCTIEKGVTGIMKAIPGPYPMVTLAKQRTSHNEFQFDAKAVIVPLISSTGHGHASMKRVHYQEGKFALGSILCAVIPIDETVLNAQFLHNYLSFFKDTLLVPLMRGAANVSLSIKSISEMLIPIPPLEEQLTINRLVELYSLKTKASQAELQTQQTLLTKLRQSILQEAVQGKLTQKWREEERGKQTSDAWVPDSNPSRTQMSQPETGADLLARIRAEKADLIRQGKLRKEKPLPPITDAEKPFELPEGWVWCRLGECSINRDGERQPIAQADRERRAKVYDYYGASGVIDKIDSFTHDGEFLLIGEDGANLVSRSTPIAFIANGKFWVNNHAHIIETFDSSTLDYLCFYFNSLDLKPFITGGFQPKLSQGMLNIIPIPLPPLTEQQAIVAQVDKLLEQVSALETENKQQQAEVGRLMQAVLREAFAGEEEVEPVNK